MTDDLGELLRMHEERARVLLAAFDAARPRDRRRVVLVEYFCRVRSCCLLTAWQAPGVRLARLRNYKLSSSLVESSTTERARQRRTTDGYRRWPGPGSSYPMNWPGGVRRSACR